jgi:hypothetical protein
MGEAKRTQHKDWRQCTQDVVISAETTGDDVPECFKLQIGDVKIYLHATVVSEFVFMINEALVRWYAKINADMEWNPSEIFQSNHIKLVGPNSHECFLLNVKNISLLFNVGPLLYLLAECTAVLVRWQFQSSKTTYLLKTTMTDDDKSSCAWLQLAALRAGITTL